MDFSARRHPGPEPILSFSEYEAFALLNGLRIMEHGWPQSFAVSIMRRVRRDLEREHARILRQDPGKLFDWEAIRARARPGDIAVDNTDPVFLTIASKAQRGPDEGQTAPLSAVCHGWAKVCEFSRDVGAPSVTFFEVVTLAHRLHHELMKAEPRRRGRGGFRRPRGRFSRTPTDDDESQGPCNQLRPIVGFLTAGMRLQKEGS